MACVHSLVLLLLGVAVLTTPALASSRLSLFEPSPINSIEKPLTTTTTTPIMNNLKPSSVYRPPPKVKLEKPLTTPPTLTNFNTTSFYPPTKDDHIGKPLTNTHVNPSSVSTPPPDDDTEPLTVTHINPSSIYTPPETNIEKAPSFNNNPPLQ
ncbi:early nodulin-75-like [Cajanus cajan]|uniref:early nodulin-75-like n=1 Tax=Cajanus cajan TaxID=3821 RepID=UPI00098DB473|nr:early nodulin-75-like [Cajanus cajan]